MSYVVVSHLHPHHYLITTQVRIAVVVVVVG